MIYNVVLLSGVHYSEFVIHISILFPNVFYIVHYTVLSRVPSFCYTVGSLEKEIATHSSILAWRIPRTEEPSGLPSMVSHSWTRLKRLSSSSRFLTSIYLDIVVFICPVLLPGESHGWRSLVGYSPRGHTESDTAERLHHFHMSVPAFQFIPYCPLLSTNLFSTSVTLFLFCR